MQIHKILLPVLMVSAALLSTTSSFAKQYYKWVDRHGSTHYTTTPPPKNALKRGKVETYGWKASTPAAAPMGVPTQVADSNVAQKNPAVTTTPAATEPGKALTPATTPTHQTQQPASKDTTNGTMTKPL